MFGSHIESHIISPGVQNHNVLHVIGVCSNPSRYNSRYRIFREWVKHMQATKNVCLWIVETAFGDRPYEVTDSCNPHHIQLRTESHAWIKENMINVAINHILVHHKGAQYFSWTDGDVFFNNPNWAQETIQQLQHYNVVQTWSQCIDLGPWGNTLTLFNSFGCLFQRGVRMQRHSKDVYGQYAHSGFSWACTRQFIMNLPGTGGSRLMDYCLLGSADWHMAWAMIGKVKETLYTNLGDTYNRKCQEWEDWALRTTLGEVGFVQGTISHAFHGNKRKRYYKERNQILSSHGYDADKHIQYDNQGLIKLVNNAKLDYEIHKYNMSRQEDGIDCD